MLQITISKRSAFIIVLAMLLVVPAVAFANDVFDDVGDTGSHVDGITFMKDSGVSIGCDATNYCPSDNVTRAQMGTFMYRLSGTDPATPPSVNADKVDGYHATDLLRSTGMDYDSTLFGVGTAPIAVAGGATVSVLEVGITAPVDGALIVNGTVNLYCTGTIFLPACGTNDGNTYVSVDGTLSDRQFYDIDGADSSLPAAAWGAANAGYVPVMAGAHTVSIDIVASTGDTIYAWSGGINVLFVPFDSTGATPASVSVPAATSGSDQG